MKKIIKINQYSDGVYLSIKLDLKELFRNDEFNIKNTISLFFERKELKDKEDKYTKVAEEWRSQDFDNKTDEEQEELYERYSIAREDFLYSAFIEILENIVEEE